MSAHMVPWLFDQFKALFSAKSDVFNAQTQHYIHLFNAQANQYQAAVLTGSSVMPTSSSAFFGSHDYVPSLAEIHEATNGYYARTRNGSVVVAVTMSELFRSLQGILAEEVIRKPVGDGTSGVI